MFGKPRTGWLGRNPALTHEVKDGELQIKIRQVEDLGTPVAANGQLVLLEFTALHSGETVITVSHEATELRQGRTPLRFLPTNAQVQIGKEVNSHSNNK